MYFLPEARGRGYGRRLLEELIALARARGFRRLTLDTASVLHEAIALYRRMGFVPFQPANMPQRCDQAYVLHLAPPP
jgi:putative acetyltransferase